MKEKYETPVMEIIAFDSEDIVRTSGVDITDTPDVPDTGAGFE